MGRPRRQVYFELCLALGYAHPNHLLADLTATELNEWVAYNTIEPINPRFRTDLGFARVCQVYATSKAKKGRTFTLNDFLPKWGMVERLESKRKQSWEHIAAVLESMGLKGRKGNPDG